MGTSLSRTCSNHKPMGNPPYQVKAPRACSLGNCSLCSCKDLFTCSPFIYLQAGNWSSTDRPSCCLYFHSVFPYACSCFTGLPETTEESTRQGNSSFTYTTRTDYPWAATPQSTPETRSSSSSNSRRKVRPVKTLMSTADGYTVVLKHY